MFDGLLPGSITNSSGQPIAAPRFVYDATKQGGTGRQIRLTIAAVTAAAVGMKGIPAKPIFPRFGSFCAARSDRFSTK
jgi:hypothetical protein